MRATLNVGHGSDVGKVRKLNEDFHRVWQYPLRDDTLLLFGVADGMGGAAAGEYASRQAVHALDEVFARYVDDVASGRSVIGLDKVVERCVKLANHRLFRSASEPARAGMGTTLTFIAMHGRRAHLGHVGDSRAWLIREGKIRQLTHDHTWVQEQMDMGFLRADEADDHEWRHLLTRALGTTSEVEP